MSVETKPPRIGWYGSQEAHDDHLAWRKEHPDGRDQGGWWMHCSRCGEMTYRVWIASQHRGSPHDWREGPRHECKEVVR